MNINNIYIISWFGNEPKLRKFRKEIHKKQLDWARTNSLKITVLAQDYEQDDYEQDVVYVHSDKFLRPCGARNALMEKFYTSNEDYAIFADNDTVIVDDVWGEPNSFIQDLRKLSDYYTTQIDFVSGINPAMQAFSKELERPEYEDNVVLRRTSRFSGGFFILKNLQKHKGFTRWFDDENFTDSNGKIIPNEEGDFCINLLMSGLRCYQSFQAVFNDMAGASRSTWSVDTSERSNKVDFAHLINRKYGMDLISLLNDTEKVYNHVGYCTSDKGLTQIRFCVNRKDRVKVLEGKNFSNIMFYDLPKSMTAGELMEWATENIADQTLLALLIESKGKAFKRLGNPKTRFNWKKLPYEHPNNLLIPKTFDIFNQMFSYQS